MNANMINNHDSRHIGVSTTLDRRVLLHVTKLSLDGKPLFTIGGDAHGNRTRLTANEARALAGLLERAAAEIDGGGR